MTEVSACTRRILAALEADLPARSSAAIEVLSIAGDPAAGIFDLGRAVGEDPGLTARMVRVANSAYYGLSGRVQTPTFAVNVLGFDTVRAIAAAAAVGIDAQTHLPEGFLAASARTAVAASLVAPRLGVRPGEAHSAGMLHNIGVWLLHRHDRTGMAALTRHAAGSTDLLHDLTLARYGTSSGELGAGLLAAWHFPAALTDALAEQHAPVTHPRTPLGATLRAGLTLAALAPAWPPSGLEDLQLAELRLCAADVDAEVLAGRVHLDAEQLESSLQRC